MLGRSFEADVVYVVQNEHQQLFLEVKYRVYSMCESGRVSETSGLRAAR